MNNKILVIGLLVCLLFCASITRSVINKKTPPVVETPDVVEKAKPPKTPELITTKISTPIPEYLNYEKTVEQLKTWVSESGGLAEFGTYGKSKNGKELAYLRVFNKNIEKERPVVLITACIHGNEPLASSTSMSWFGSMLDKYSKDPKITALLDSRDIYFVPVVSPDSYPNSRHVEGVDPNRNFPTLKKPDLESVTPVSKIRELFLKIKPSAVISGHTWGQCCLVPWGDQMSDCPDSVEYKRIVGEMTKMMGYRYMRACDMYGPQGLNNPPIKEDYATTPIFGSEIDWYYRGGSFAIVMEMGTHQRIPSKKDITSEFEKTFEGVLFFIKEAPLVKLKVKDSLTTN